MHTTQAGAESTQQSFDFQDLGGRKVMADFSGGFISSDGGALLLREMDRITALSTKVSGCFTDGRDARFVEHTLPVLLRQRIHGLALGYEDLNDHDRLRTDPLLAAVCGCSDVLGAGRLAEGDKGKPLAGKSTLNRLELGAQSLDGRYKKIQAHPEKLQALLLEEGVKAIPKHSEIIVLDFDATDDPLHGRQEGRFFHGYYGHYCYLPLYCFCGDIPLWAQLRTADRDAADGTLEALQLIVAALRARFGKDVIIVVRGDSGFCREAVMAWIESQEGLYYCLGLARNVRLTALLEPSFVETAMLLNEKAVLAATAAGAARPAVEGTARTFAELRYRTLKSWSCERRVVGKAGITGGKDNPRFIVTNVAGTEAWACAHKELFGEGRTLYEKFYCARGDMENRIKEQQLDLFADRTSTAHLASNQLRLWFSTFAYLLLRGLRACALQGTRLAAATAASLRLHLLKIGAQITVSVRRFYVRLSSACPLAAVFAAAHQRLRALPAG
jgi:hypothetical protein